MWRKCFLEVHFVDHSQREGQCMILADPDALDFQSTHCSKSQNLDFITGLYKTVYRQAGGCPIGH